MNKGGQKMKLDISIKYNDAYNCLDNLIVDATKWWGRNYELLFAGSWGFYYKQIGAKGREALGDNINSSMNYPWDCFEKYHGVKINIIKNADYQDILRVIREELKENRPVIIYMDTFWCPWYKSNYQEIHSVHYCLAIGIDDSNNLLIADSQFANNGTTLPEYNFSKGYGEYMTFSLKEPESASMAWRKIIRNAVDRIMSPAEDISIFEQMRNLGNDIRDKLDYATEIRGVEEYPLRAKLFQSLYNIGRGRKQFSIALNYLGNLVNSHELLLLSDRVRLAGERWMSLFGIMGKSYYLQGDDRDRILKRVVNKINEAALDEEDIAKNLIKLCENEALSGFDNLLKQDNQLYKKPLRDYYYVDISKVMNNQGFSSSLSLDCNAEISNGGRYFLTEGLPAEKEWNIENMKFLFPDTDNGLNDNISCFGQIIDIQPCKYGQIMVLGCAELGNHSDFIEIIYSDGCTERVSIEFTSWLISAANNKEIIAWTGKGAARTKTKVETYPFAVNLFAQMHTLQIHGEMKGIRLPECPNLHIFAVTLANSD